MLALYKSQKILSRVFLWMLQSQECHYYQPLQKPLFNKKALWKYFSQIFFTDTRTAGLDTKAKKGWLIIIRKLLQGKEILVFHRLLKYGENIPFSWYFIPNEITCDLFWIAHFNRTKLVSKIIYIQTPWSV